MFFIIDLNAPLLHSTAPEPPSLLDGRRHHTDLIMKNNGSG